MRQERNSRSEGGPIELQHHVLVVEDEPASRALICGYFASEGYRVTAVGNGGELRRALAAEPADLITLDVRLPGEDGISLLRQLRGQTDVGIMVITAHRDDEVERVVALELGADDYVCKPFNAREMLARARNILRRCAVAARPRPGNKVVRFAGWTLDLDSWRLTGADEVEVSLTRAEYEILATLVSQPNRVLTRDNLLDGSSHRLESPTDRTIDALVGRIRRKIEDDPRHPRFIQTVHGVGYVFRPPPQREGTSGS